MRCLRRRLPLRSDLSLRCFNAKKRRESNPPFFYYYCPICCDKIQPSGGASRALSRLASAPVRSSTVVHSRTVLGAKHDIAARCIHRVQSNRFMFLSCMYVSQNLGHYLFYVLIFEIPAFPLSGIRIHQQSDGIFKGFFDGIIICQPHHVGRFFAFGDFFVQQFQKW